MLTYTLSKGVSSPCDNCDLCPSLCGLDIEYCVAYGTAQEREERALHEKEEKEMKQIKDKKERP